MWQAVGPNPEQAIVLAHGLTRADAVDRGRRDEDHAGDAVLEGAGQHVCGAVDLRGVGIRGAAEGQGGRGVHDQVHPAHRRVHGRPVADVAHDGLDCVA